MPIADYCCEKCDLQEKNYFFSSSQGISPPSCPEHGPMIVDYSAPPPRNRTGRQTFDPVEVTDWNNQEVTLTSVEAIRKFEKAAEANGHPHVFRNFSQGRSNKDVGVFGRGDHMKPVRTVSKRGIPFVTRGPNITVNSEDLE